MNYIIFENGAEINRIGASEAFISDYCARHGYTYELEPEPSGAGPEPTAPALETRVGTLEAAVEDADAMNVDQEYRLTMLELGLTDKEI